MTEMGLSKVFELEPRYQQNFIVHATLIMIKNICPVIDLNKGDIPGALFPSLTYSNHM